MGDWITWLIPLIALAVWVLANLARNQQDQRRPGRTNPAPPAEPTGPRPRRTSAEIDDFLSEVRRRRGVTEQKKETAKKVAVSAPAETPRARPSLAVPQPVTPQAKLPARSTSPPPRPRADEFAPPPLPALVPTAEEVVVARIVQPGAPDPRAGSQPALPRRVLLGGFANPWQLLQFLRNPQTLATAVVLREVFEPPITRRKR